MNAELSNTQFELPTNAFDNLIKLVGVGGGGGNAVDNMYASGAITGVSYLLLNTDKQDLDNSIIPQKLVIGPDITHGEGAGDQPEVAAQAAEASKAEIVEALKAGGTKMVFVTAGLGGGTGTGAAPLVCKFAREADLLTVGVVTLPFVFEGPKKRRKAILALEEVKKNVDALLIINNEKLADVYGEIKGSEALVKADQTMLEAVKSISDMVIKNGKINIDFADVKKTLKNGGISIINSGYASGSNRLEEVVHNAISAPIMNSFDILESTRLLIHLYSSPVNEVLTSEMGEIGKHLTNKIKHDFDFIFGLSVDDNLQDGEIKLTILATGFDFMDSRDEQLRNISSLGRKEEQEARKKVEKMEETLYGEELRHINRRDDAPFLLSIDDLDNQALITSLSERPTYKRDGKQLEKLEKIRQRTRKPSVNTTANSAPNRPKEQEQPKPSHTHIKGFDK